MVSSTRQLTSRLLEVALLPIAVVLLFAGFAYTVPDYLSSMNLQQLMRDLAEPGLIVLAMTIVVLSGGIDLSIGATFAIANFVALYLFKVHACPLAMTIVLTAISGSLIGIFNGVLVGYMRTRPFLTTLSMLLILRAGYDLAADNYAVQLAEAMYNSPGWELLGSGNPLGLPLSMWVMIAVAILAHLFMTHTRAGIHIRAVGAGRKAARHAGIAINRSLCLAYVLSGCISAIAGLLYAARQNSAGSDTGSGMELAAIAAVVLGGISLSGGRGSILRALLGALLLFLVMNGLLRMDMTGSMSSAVTGVILLGSVAMSARTLKVRHGPSHEGQAYVIPPRVQVVTSTVAEISPLLNVTRLSKVYGLSYALREVSLAINNGEIHALIGENGAGKSTLCKIIAGAISPSAGQLELNGHPLVLHSPQDGLRAGIAMVYQESSLISSMSVAQNLRLGEEPWLEWGTHHHYAARELLLQVGLDIDPDTQADQLSFAQGQLVEIARAIGRKASLLIFDEPTASLTPQEVQRFLAMLQTLKAQGVAIIFITHALEEALMAADRISVLRDGVCISAGIPSHTLDRENLVRLMVGRELLAERRAGQHLATKYGSKQVGLQLRGVTLGHRLKDVNVTFLPGRVTALAGLVGSGRTLLARLVTGGLKANRIHRGQVLRDGKEVRYKTPRQAIADGVVYVTEDRNFDGLFNTLDVGANLYLAQLATPTGWRFWYSRTQADQLARNWSARLAIAGLQSGKPLSLYSGGNQQKVTVARALVQQPQVILLDEPTPGVDVGAIVLLHQVIDTLAEQGRAVVVVSSYLPEVFRLADRVVVMREGRI
ncbi:MAG: ATP-binding cassette domain-containing protein, partial [Pseudomonadota bacterium]